jgi:hypothetical protein
MAGLIPAIDISLLRLFSRLQRCRYAAKRRNKSNP